MQEGSTRSRYKLVKWIALAIALAVGLAIYFLFNPEDSPFFPKCILYATTGIKCPGCGSQRAMHFLFHGEVGKAFSVHPLLVLSIPYLLFASYMEYLGGKVRYPRLRRLFLGKNASIIVFIVIVGYWIGRNIWNW